LLYAAGGDVNLNMYELPPVLSESIYDIRYESQRYVENLNNGFQTINFNGVMYPLTIKTENLSIRLQDETGGIINTIIQPGEEISINNNISKLQVSSLITPDHYSLEQNYPNPFNPVTTINFTLPEDVEVILTIYNALGQKVTDLVNGSMKGGYYKYTWNSDNHASGLYIYQLRTANFTSTKKMILMK
jgi:hypothetical protein